MWVNTHQNGENVCEGLNDDDGVMMWKKMIWGDGFGEMVNDGGCVNCKWKEKHCDDCEWRLWRCVFVVWWLKCVMIIPIKHTQWQNKPNLSFHQLIRSSFMLMISYPHNPSKSIIFPSETTHTFLFVMMIRRRMIMIYKVISHQTIIPCLVLNHKWLAFKWHMFHKLVWMVILWRVKCFGSLSLSGLKWNVFVHR